MKHVVTLFFRCIDKSSYPPLRKVRQSVCGFVILPRVARVNAEAIANGVIGDGGKLRFC